MSAVVRKHRKAGERHLRLRPSGQEDRKLQSEALQELVEHWFPVRVVEGTIRVERLG